MLRDVVSVQALDNYRLQVKFEDGVEGIVDLTQSVSFTGVFAPLRDPEQFASVRVDPELGTVCWPSGADLDPEVLYGVATPASGPAPIVSAPARA